MQFLRTFRHLQCACQNNAKRTTSELGSPLIKSTFLSRKFFHTGRLLCNDGYSKDEQTYILEVINKCGDSEEPKKILGEGNSKKIRTHREKVGCFTRLEDLLKVQGLGPRSVKKLCDKILQMKEGDTVKNAELGLKKRNQESASFIVPILSNDHISSLQNITAIQIGINTISWASLDCSKKELLSWDVIDLTATSGNADLHYLCTLGKEISSKLPDAGVYVFENVNWSNMVGAQLSVKVHMYRAQLTAMLVALIESRENCSSTLPKVVFLKSRLTSRLFKQQVGSERVSSQTVVENFFQQRVSAEYSNVYIGPLMKALYLEKKGYYKESLCESLLLALAFMDVVVFKRIDLVQPTKCKTAKAVSTTEER